MKNSDSNLEGIAIEKKTIVIYLITACFLAWSIWGILALTGNDLSSSLAAVLMPISMWTPAAAVFIAKKLTGGTRIIEPSFKPKFKGNIRWYLSAWLLTFVLITLGGVLYYCIFNDQFDPGMRYVRMALESEQPKTIITDSVVLSAFISRILITLTLNSFVTMILALGEEIGWRGFLFPAVRRRISEAKTHIICGVIWGLWHAPVIAMGHNYGTDYLWFPWLGIFAMCLTSTFIGTFLSYITSKSGSIWPAAIAHGTINSISNLPIFFIREEPAGILIIYYGIILVIPFLLCVIAMNMVSARKAKAKVLL